MPHHETSVPTLSPARQRLAAKWIPYARVLARPFCRACPTEAEDFESAAYLGLVEAAARYRRGYAPFRSYLCIRVIGALRDHYRAHERQLLRGDYAVAAWYDPRVDRAPPIGRELEDNELRDRLLGSFAPQVQTLVALWVASPSVAALARDLGCTRATISRRLTSAFECSASRARSSFHRTA